MTHTPLWFEFPSFVTPICMADAQASGSVNLRDWAPEWQQHHPVLGSLAGLFAFKNYIEALHPEASQIGICQYRKFISNTDIGLAVKNYPVMHMLHLRNVSALPLAALMRPQAHQTFLIGQPANLGPPGGRQGYLAQYKDSHHIEDLLRFTAVAVELGVLDKQNVLPFFDQPVFLPGGVELGVYEANFWKSAVTSIEAVVRACVTQHAYKRDGYQARAWAFCAERLGSFLLLQHFSTLMPSTTWAKDFFGRMVLVTKEDHQEYVGGT